MMKFLSCFFFGLFSITAFSQSARESFIKNERFPVSVEPSIVTEAPPLYMAVFSKSDLSKLSLNIRNAVKKGEKNIIVNLRFDSLCYDRLPIYLYDIDAPDVCISIIGNGATLIAGGTDYVRGELVSQVDCDHIFITQTGRSLSGYGEVIQATEPIVVVDAKKKLCKIKADKAYDFFPGMKIQVSEWFHSPIYSVSKTEGGYIHFIADDLMFDDSKKCYNVNYDVGVSSLNPRFRLITPERIQRIQLPIHECTVSSFLCLYRVKLKSFVLSDVHFKGSAYHRDGLFHFRDVDAQLLRVSDCSFEGINERVINLVSAHNFVFKNNTLSDCYYGAVYSRYDCMNTIVKDNSFSQMNKSWTNCACVACYGRGFVVSGNSFADIGYISVSSGAHYNWVKGNVSHGVIEHNEIFFNDEYFKNCWKYTLIDSGAIYLGTMIDQVIVRYNYIHDYQGVNSNRAIYCDDGAKNVKIYGNVIRDIGNGYAILSWRARSLNKSIPDTNDGIDVYYNIIWGRYKFDERESSSCIHGKNLILYDEKDGIPSNELKNFAFQENDVFSSGASVRDNRIVLSRKAMREIKRFPTYNSIKQWIR